MIIYKITNLINNKIYIGKTARDFECRLNEHFSTKALERDVNSGRDNSYLHKAILKYGKNNFKYEIIDTALDAEELNQKEKFWIKHFKDLGFLLYNLTDGGDGVVGYHHTDGTKKIISNSSSNRTFVNNGVDNKFLKYEDAVRLVEDEGWVFGNLNADRDVYKTDRFREKSSKANKGRLRYNNGEKCISIWPDEVEYYESLGYKRGSLPPSVKWSWYTNGEVSKKVQEKDEQAYIDKGWYRGRSSISMNITSENRSRGAKKIGEKLKLKGKPIRCIELDRVFNNISDIEKWLGHKARHIYDCCRGAREVSFGYHWEWASVEDE